MDRENSFDLVDDAREERAELDALIALGEAARDFSLKWKPRPKITGSYARALRVLADAARAFAQKSDAAWAAEVVELQSRIAFLEGSS